jgi:RNA polymerase sigma-B factor
MMTNHPTQKLPRKKPKPFDAKHFKGVEEKWLHRSLASLTEAEQRTCKEDILDTMRPYVEDIVRSMARRDVDPVDDLVQVGCIGVLKALEQYNPAEFGSFKRYASFYISGEIRRYLRDQALMFKAPRSLQELYYRLNMSVHKFRVKEGRSPSDEELLAELHCAPEELDEVRTMEQRSDTLSLEEIMLPVASSSHGGVPQRNQYFEELMDLSERGNTFHRIETGLNLKDALGKLAPELRQAVEMRYFQDMPQRRIAEKSGVSQMQISRRLRKALQQLDGLLR